MESFDLKVARTETANGGWEWFLLADDQRVYPPSYARVGVFTGPEATVPQMTRVLLGRFARTEDS